MLLRFPDSSHSLVCQLNTRPGQIRIEACHCRSNAQRIGAEILLIHNAVGADNEAHYPARFEFRRPSDQRKTAGHVPRLDVTLRTTIRILALCRQDAKIVAIILNWLVAIEFARKTSFLRCMDQLSQRTLYRVPRRRPVKPVLVTGRADNACGVDPSASCPLGQLEIFALSIHKREESTNCRQLITTYAAVNDRLRPCTRVKGPPPIAFNNRDWKWPTIWTNIQFRTAGPRLIDRVLLVVEGKELLKLLLVRESAFETHNAVSIGPRMARQLASSCSRSAATSTLAASSADAKLRWLSARVGCRVPSEQTAIPIQRSHVFGILLFL
jgi:hypothetical protein